MNFSLRSRLFKDRCTGVHFHRVISGCGKLLPSPPLIKIAHQMHALMPDIWAESTPKNLSNMRVTTITRFVRHPRNCSSRAIMNEDYYERCTPPWVHKFPVSTCTRIFLSWFNVKYRCRETGILEYLSIN